MQRSRGRTPVSVLVLVSLVLNVTLVPTDARAVTLEEEFPIDCPPKLPYYGPEWENSIHTFPHTFHVPKYVDEDEPVPFSVPELTITSSTSSSGKAWYRPTQRAFYTPPDNGQRYVWWHHSPAEGPQYECQRYWIFPYAISVAQPTGVLRGWAVLVTPEDEGTDTRETGGGEEDEICYEYYEWWYDENGYYNEEVLYTWCEPMWET